MTVSEANKTLPATNRQTFTIFRLTGEDVRVKNLTREQASELISKLLKEKGVEKKTVKAKKETQDEVFQRIYNEAYEAGVEAAKNVKPRPMTVMERANPFDDRSEVINQWHVNEGVCGFAWVIVKSGNSAFARWLKKNNLARPDSYYGGVNIWIREYNQSMERKMAHASAMAKVIQDKLGDKITAYADSRMD